MGTPLNILHLYCECVTHASDTGLHLSELLVKNGRVVELDFLGERLHLDDVRVPAHIVIKYKNQFEYT